LKKNSKPTRPIEEMSAELSNRTARAVELLEPMETQQQHLVKFFARQNKSTTELRQLQANRESQQTVLTTLQAIVLSMRDSSPPTPSSQIRIRKKRKPRTPDMTQTQESDDSVTE
jgi:hypothetical protein